MKRSHSLWQQKDIEFRDKVQDGDLREFATGKQNVYTWKLAHSSILGYSVCHNLALDNLLTIL